jgi:hypothetical protein
MPSKPPQHRPKGVKPFEQRRAEADKARGTAAQRGYDAAWRAVRKQYLAAHPWCCETGCNEAATDVDHIQSVRDRPDLRLHWSNLRGFCHSHHSARTSREQSWNR